MQRTYHRQRDPTAEVCQDDDGDLGLEALLAALRHAVPVNMSPGACKPSLDEEITERYEREAAAVEQEYGEGEDVLRVAARHQILEDADSCATVEVYLALNNAPVLRRFVCKYNT